MSNLHPERLSDLCVAHATMTHHQYRGRTARQAGQDAPNLRPRFPVDDRVFDTGQRAGTVHHELALLPTPFPAKQVECRVYGRDPDPSCGLPVVARGTAGRPPGRRPVPRPALPEGHRPHSARGAGRPRSCCGRRPRTQPRRMRHRRTPSAPHFPRATRSHPLKHHRGAKCDTSARAVPAVGADTDAPAPRRPDAPTAPTPRLPDSPTPRLPDAGRRLTLRRSSRGCPSAGGVREQREVVRARLPLAWHHRCVAAGVLGVVAPHSAALPGRGDPAPRCLGRCVAGLCSARARLLDQGQLR